MERVCSGEAFDGLSAHFIGIEDLEISPMVRVEFVFSQKPRSTSSSPDWDLGRGDAGIRASIEALGDVREPAFAWGVARGGTVDE